MKLALRVLLPAALGAGLGLGIAAFVNAQLADHGRARQVATCALLQPGNPDSNSVLQLCLVSRYDWKLADAFRPYRDLSAQYFSLRASER